MSSVLDSVVVGLSPVEPSLVVDAFQVVQIRNQDRIALVKSGDGSNWRLVRALTPHTYGVSQFPPCGIDWGVALLTGVFGHDVLV